MNFIIHAVWCFFEFLSFRSKPDEDELTDIENQKELKNI